MHNYASAYFFIITILCNCTSTYSAAPSAKKLYLAATTAGAVGSAVVSAIQEWRKPRKTAFANIGQCIIGKGTNKQESLDAALNSIRTNHYILNGQASALCHHIHGSTLALPLQQPDQLGILARLKLLETELPKKASDSRVKDHIKATDTVLEALLIYMQTTQTPQAEAFNKTIEEAHKAVAAD